VVHAELLDREIADVGEPYPTGNPGHSAIYDYNALSCDGPPCGAAE
jgi:hypothetical protein